MTQEKSELSPYDLIAVVKNESWFIALRGVVCEDVNIPITVFAKSTLINDVVPRVFEFSDTSTAAERWAAFLYTHISYADLVAEVIKTGLFVSAEEVEHVVLPSAYVAQCLSLEEFNGMYIETKNVLVFALLILYTFDGVS